MRVELGAVRWSPSASDHRWRSYACAASLTPGNAALLCIDDVEDWDALARALATLLASGAAALAAGREPEAAAAAGARVLILRDGRLEPFTDRAAGRTAARRVAERGGRSVDPLARRA
jgi:hypothetical protein